MFLLPGWGGQDSVGPRSARNGGKSHEIHPSAYQPWSSRFCSHPLPNWEMARRNKIWKVRQDIFGCLLTKCWEIINSTNLTICALSDTIPCLLNSSFRVVLDRYLSKSVELMETTVKTLERSGSNTERWVPQLCRMYYRLAHYTDALYKSYEDRLTSNEWQAALRLRQHKVTIHWWPISC